ncbi:MAG: hypothetical protein ACKVOL_00300 [Novosphingobium sp.]
MEADRTRLENATVLGGLVLLALLVRAATLANPVIGFDEQFYLLVGTRMLHGAVPYVDIWDRKPIGLFLIYMVGAGIGPDPFLQYKLLALAFVAATAFTIYRMARKAGAGLQTALCAAALYVLWLNVCEGEAGQSPVFYNMPVTLAALLVQSALQTRRRIVLRGVAAMLLVGLALQIKYTAIFEGMFFGLALLWAGFQSGLRPRLIAAAALIWAGCALAPTALAAAWYWRMGALDTFVFANFLSIFGKLPDPATARIEGLLTIAAILLPLACVVAARYLGNRNLGARNLGSRPARPAALDFAASWLIAALTGFLLFGNFLSPGNALPLIGPLCLCCAPFLDDARRRMRIAVPLMLFVALAGQAVIWITASGKGSRAEAMAVAAAATPADGCIWVYDGYPALYLLTGSCLPTRWVFPGHLNTANEASVGAIGVDPATEVRRILATQPKVIVDDAPAYDLGNRTTRAIVTAALQRDYHLVRSVRTGTARFRLVYRRNAAGLAAPRAMLKVGQH